MADGQIYDSKSAYRAELKARGYREVGNDAPAAPRPYTPENVERDIADSIQMIEADHPEASTSTGPRNTRDPRTDGAPVALRAKRRTRVRTH